MAYLLDIATGNYFPLAPHHTFGRLAASVDTHIDKPYASKLHAAIEWNGTNWRIKNLGLNGTWVNDTALEQGESQKLAVNDVIYIAEQSDPGFKVIDLTPPADMLWPLDAAGTDTAINIGSQPVQPIYLERYHLLPDAQLPELALYYVEQDQQWYLETTSAQGEQNNRAIQPGDMVQFNNTHWRFVRAQVYGPTEARAHSLQKLIDVEFVFSLSLDEETTQLELHQPKQKQTIDLGVRSHHYLLLQLARHRADDIARGLDSKSQGWIYADHLAAELGLDITHMNIQIFRARKQFADNLPETVDHESLLERRGGKIRFGGVKFKIYKGATLTTTSPTNTGNSSEHTAPNA